MTPSKTDLRRTAQTLRDGAAAATPDAAEALAALAPKLRANCVALYRPIRSELDPTPLARTIDAPLWALPVIRGPEMSFHRWAEGEPLSPGALGIDEPAPAPIAPDLLLVPLLAFNRQGGRLGYGAGHYDRYIAAHKGVRTIGIAFAVQELQGLPLEEHDQPLQAIATEREWITVGDTACD